MHQISIKGSLAFGWQRFKERPWFLIGIVLLVMVLSSILTSIADTQPEGGWGIVLAILVLVGHLFIEMGLISFALVAERDVASASLKDLWKPEPFWRYIGVKILQALIVLIGLVLLVIPGIFAALVFMFATYATVDAKLGPIESLKASYRMTAGNRWKLLGFVLALVGINILGALAVLVGLFVSIPVSLLAVAHVYRTLSGHSGGHISA